ncbi:hypothetical protein TRVL_04708 [Trypanosoma vivax]|nr:hypothetical protein TRVL_04708 [Trypanosoma vivax]
MCPRQPVLPPTPSGDFVVRWESGPCRICRRRHGRWRTTRQALLASRARVERNAGTQVGALPRQPNVSTGKPAAIRRRKRTAGGQATRTFLGSVFFGKRCRGCEKKSRARLAFD